MFGDLGASVEQLCTTLRSLQAAMEHLGKQLDQVSLKLVSQAQLMEQQMTILEKQVSAMERQSDLLATLARFFRFFSGTSGSAS